MMRNTFLFGFSLLLGAPAVFSDITPETATIESLGQPTDDWFVNRTREGAYLFDGDSGHMLGLFSLTPHTPAIAVNRSRGEVYAAESYWSRLYRGTREDVLTVYDITTLLPVAEIDIPDKMAQVVGDTNIGLMGNGRHVLVYNLTPAQSVSVVDVESRQLAAEISTPGCGMIMPVNGDSFLMVCGDGSVQLIQLAADGTETNRTRSEQFFDVEDDAVFDRAASTRGGWLLVSHAGLAYEISVDGAEISVGEPWSLVDDVERNESWRPGGTALLTVHRSSNLAFVLMHQGTVDTHYEPGSELWVFDLGNHKRVMRWVLDEPWHNILVLQGEHPRLVAHTNGGTLEIYDALQQRLERTIDDPGPGVWLLQGF